MTDTLKRASWLELFYDLAFVALIAQLTYLAADYHHTWLDFLHIFLVWYMIFMAWWGTTANRNLQSSESAADRLFVQAQMILALLMSIALPEVFEGELFRFFVLFAGIRGIQIFMILRLYRISPEVVPNTHNILQGISIAAILWVIAAFMAAPYAYVVAFCALALDILVAQTKGKGNKMRLLNLSHLHERLGLFLMLVMGESMLVVAIANTATSNDITRPVIVMSGLILVICLWWMYFDYLDSCGERVRPKLFPYIHAHAILYGSVVLLAASYKNMLKHAEPTSTDLLLLGTAIFGSALSIAMIRGALHGLRKRLLLGSMFCLVVILLVIGFSLTDPNMFLVLGTITGATVGLAVLDYWSRASYFEYAK